MTSTQPPIALCSEDQTWFVVGTHDPRVALAAVRELDPTAEITLTDVEQATPRWGRWAEEPDDPSTWVQLNPCSADEPDAEPFLDLEEDTVEDAIQH